MISNNRRYTIRHSIPSLDEVYELRMQPDTGCASVETKTDSKKYCIHEVIGLPCTVGGKAKVPPSVRDEAWLKQSLRALSEYVSHLQNAFRELQSINRKYVPALTNKMELVGNSTYAKIVKEEEVGNEIIETIHRSVVYSKDAYFRVCAIAEYVKIPGTEAQTYYYVREDLLDEK